jgi:predicted DCC family thiol-disulfide oxidoreductase YuxK
MTAIPADAPVLLFDGTCGLCHGFVRFLLKRDRKGTLRLATLEGPVGAAFVARHPKLSGIDSVVWIEGVVGSTEGRSDGKELAFTKSDAALHAFAYLGAPWSLLGVFRFVPRFIRDRVYDFVARNRYRWFGRYDVCPVPSAEDRARYL